MNEPDEHANASLSHLAEDGSLRMVDVGPKSSTRREAVAQAFVRMSGSTLDLVEDKALPKGDALVCAKVAGILGAKRTPELVPLTHPLMLDLVDLSFHVDRTRGGIEIEAVVRCDGRTGAEIEAMTACAIAALTIYDMCKSAERGITIERIELIRKSGGKSGTWVKSEESRVKGKE